MTPMSNQTLTHQHTQELARSIMNDKQAAEFEAHMNAILRSARRVSGVPRQHFHATAARRHGVAYHHTKIPDLDEMACPRFSRIL